MWKVTVYGSRGMTPPLQSPYIFDPQIFFTLVVVSPNTKSHDIMQVIFQTLHSTLKWCSTRPID